MKKKAISVTGPNGTFKGEVVVTTRTNFKKVKTETNRFTETKQVVHDIQTTVNGHLFGSITKDIEDETILEIELMRHESLLAVHLNKLAKTEVGLIVKNKIEELGFKESKLVTKSKIDELSAWIQEHTKRVGFDNRRGPRAKNSLRRKERV